MAAPEARTAPGHGALDSLAVRRSPWSGAAESAYDVHGHVRRIVPGAGRDAVESPRDGETLRSLGRSRRGWLVGGGSNRQPLRVQHNWPCLLDPPHGPSQNTDTDWVTVVRRRRA
jgi:hypothetical protein